MKLIIKNIVLLAVFCIAVVNSVHAQEKKRIDGVIAVVGNHIILDSDIDKGFAEAKVSGDKKERTRCEFLEMLLENKLFAHHAVQDSLVVTDIEVNDFVNGQIDSMVEYYGSMENTLRANNKRTFDEFKDYFADIVRTNKLGDAMQKKIVANVQITPEEVRQYYNEIPESELPVIGEEVELAEIVIKPEISKAETDRVLNILRSIKDDVYNNGSSFTSKVFVYSEDQGSVSTGGVILVDKKAQLVKEFKDAAYSLKEGEISEPFKSPYGYHIIYLEKIEGAKLITRHILMVPKPETNALIAAKEKAEKIRLSILNKEMTFAEAAMSFSDQKDNKANGGIMMNPNTGETKFELNRMEDRSLYAAVSDLEVNEISMPSLVRDPRSMDSQFYRLVEVTQKYPEHVADLKFDYLKIRDVALRNKKADYIQKWMRNNVGDTYIFIADDYKKCDFPINWTKK